MELVEGPTLADRLAGGPLPVSEALDVARQIAEALEAAHVRGIIHRNLEPANVKVCEDGTVTVLDFGLAKGAAPPDAAPASASRSRWRASHRCSEGPVAPRGHQGCTMYKR